VPKNEDGEFELILGNGQLLSIFFIVVILLGVFFAMGYIVGRNSTPLGTAEVATARKPDVKPLVVDPPAAAPKSEAPAPEPAPAAAEKPKPEPPPAKAAEKAALPPPQQQTQPAAGQTYLQLAATTQHEAEALVEVLRKNSFKAMIQEVPEKPGLHRVLVGPMSDAEVNKMRADLQGKGFPGNAAIKRTF
jgi:DedD protein